MKGDKKEKMKKEEIKRRNLKERGITLVALVVTIIILLILAGVTLNIALSENGLFQRAKGTAKRYENASGNETEILNNLDKTIAELSGEDLRPAIDNDKSYVGKYADLDGDITTAEGIIYADLATDGSGEWGNNGYGKYSYSKETKPLKSYVIGDKVTSDKFGNEELEIISAKKGANGANRFYVMALEDVGSETYYWYKNASGNLNKLEDKTDIEFGKEEPKGKANTEDMIANWNLNGAEGSYGIQDLKDMWGIIKEGNNLSKYGLEWFVPSRAEWSAFGDMIWTKFSKNYSRHNLQLWYWSSSIMSVYDAYCTRFSTGFINGYSVRSNYCVRLSTTF